MKTIEIYGDNGELIKEEVSEKLHNLIIQLAQDIHELKEITYCLLIPKETVKTCDTYFNDIDEVKKTALTFLSDYNKDLINP